MTVIDSNDMTASRDVAVTVTNMEEDGIVTLSNRQPAVGTPITATLSDADGGVTNLTWMWRSNDQCDSRRNIAYIHASSW